jgi:hypothetical protein
VETNLSKFNHIYEAIRAVLDKKTTKETLNSIKLQLSQY